MIVEVGKKQIYEGNAKPLAIPLGAAGAVTTVKVTMSSNAKKYTQTISIRPQDVVIVAEPLSSAPALYLGKPLIPLEGNVRIVAVANMKSAAGKVIDSSKLSYVWTIDGTTIQNSSGFGKDSILVASPYQYRERTVSVVVKSSEAGVAGGASISLAPAEPIVRLYENDPLLGILFDHTLADSYAITSTERTIYGAPYSFTISKGVPALKWFLNGASAQTGNSITLRPTGSGSGSASLSLIASTGDSTTATANLSVSFGTAKGTNLFGL